MLLPEHATIDQMAALAATLPQELAAEAAADGVLRLDASALRGFDTSTIALLMQARRAAQEAGRGFEVVGAPAQLAQLAALYGVEELLSLRDTRAADAPSAASTAKPEHGAAPLAAMAEKAANAAPGQTPQA